MFWEKLATHLSGRRLVRPSMFGDFYKPLGGVENGPPTPLEPSNASNAADATKVQNTLSGIGYDDGDIGAPPVYRVADQIGTLNGKPPIALRENIVTGALQIENDEIEKRNDAILVTPEQTSTAQFVPSSVLSLKPASADAQSCDERTNIDVSVLTPRANGKATTLTAVSGGTAKGSPLQMSIFKEKLTPVTPIVSKVPSKVIEVRLRHGKSQIDRLVSATPESGISAEATEKKGPGETIAQQMDHNLKEANPKVKDMSISPKDDASSNESSQDEKRSDFLAFEVPCEEEYIYNVYPSELVSEETSFQGALSNILVIVPDKKVADCKDGGKEVVDKSVSTESAPSILPGNLCDIAPDMEACRFKAGGDDSVDSGAFEQASRGTSLQCSGSAAPTHSKTCLHQQASEESSSPSIGFQTAKSTYIEPNEINTKDEALKVPTALSQRIDGAIKKSEDDVSPEKSLCHSLPKAPLTCQPNDPNRSPETVPDIKPESIVFGMTTESFNSDEEVDGEVLSRKTGAPLHFARIFDGASNQITSEASGSNLTSLDVRPNLFTMSGYETQTSSPLSSQCAISPGSDGVPVSSQNSHYAMPGNKEACNQLQRTQISSSLYQPSTSKVNLGIFDSVNGDKSEREVHEDMTKIPSMKENLTRLKLDKSDSQSESDASRFKSGASVSVQRMDSNISSASKGSNGSKRGVELLDSDEIAGQAIDRLGSTQKSASGPHPALSIVVSLPDCQFPAKEECGPSKTLDSSLAAPLTPEHAAPVASTTASVDFIAEENKSHSQTRKPDVAKDNDRKGDKSLAREKVGSTTLVGDRAPMTKASNNRQAPPRLPVRRMMSFSKGGKDDGAPKDEAKHIPAVVSDDIDNAMSAERGKENSGPLPLASRQSSNLGGEIPLRRVAAMNEDREDRGRAVRTAPSKDRTTSRERGMSETQKVSGASFAKTSLANKTIRSFSFTKSSKRENPIPPSKKVSLAEKEIDVEPRTTAFTFSRVASTSRKDGKEEKRSKGAMRILSRIKSNVFSRASSMTAKQAQPFQERQPTAHTEAIDTIPENEFELDDGPGTTFFPIDRNVVEVQRNSKKSGEGGTGFRRLLSRDMSKDRRSSVESGAKSGRWGKSKERD